MLIRIDEVGCVGLVEFESVYGPGVADEALNAGLVEADDSDGVPGNDVVAFASEETDECDRGVAVDVHVLGPE